MQGLIPEEYAPYAHSIFAAMTNIEAVIHEGDVAEVIFGAANDQFDRMHFPAGADAIALAQ